jgi:hypothetical protein
MSEDRAGSALAPFYIHLIATTCTQLAVVVVALAQRALPPWCAGVLVAGTLALAAHGAVAIAPRVRGRS